jgi:hypothetical protein
MREQWLELGADVELEFGAERSAFGVCFNKVVCLLCRENSKVYGVRRGWF